MVDLAQMGRPRSARRPQAQPARSIINFYDDQMYSFTTINLDVWRTVSQVTTPGYGSTTVIVNDTDGHTRSY